MFLIRGQDRLGAQVVRLYADMLASAGGAPEVVKAVREHAEKIEAWPKKKIADWPESAFEPAKESTEAKPPEDS